jgi:serpin B
MRTIRNTLLALLGFTIGFAPMSGTPQVQTVVDGNTTFALNLYSRLAANPGNLFFSPYSISTCLGMLYAGAAGNTELQMSEVLGFGTNQAQFTSLFGQLQDELATDQATNVVELNIANALWFQEGFPILPAFLQTATNQYQANVGQADFLTDSAEVTDEINNWVAQETQNKIKNILPPGAVNPNTRLVLANAIYFLGTWTTAFQESNTTTQLFHLSSTTVAPAPLMHQPLLVVMGPNGQPADVTFNYMQSYPFLGTPSKADFQAIELPYGSNQLSMVILLPSQIDGLAQLERQLSPAFLSNVLARMTPQPVEIFLPRFTLASSFDLGATLAAMGMPDAFAGGTADFSGIDGGRDLFVSFVLHKAWGQVNEAGTEAAAATVIGITGTIAPFSAAFRADHPFLFLIRDTQTGSVLFLGRLTNPNPSAGQATPALTVTPSVGGLRISWPAILTGLALQQSQDLTSWTSMSGVTSDGTNNFITNVAPPSGNLFFRLSPP